MKMLEELINKDVTRKFKPPGKTTVPRGFTSIFLGGSIEMDTAEEWQERITKTLLNKFNKLIVFNPRRDNWDSSWKQELTDKNFYGQVDWEHQQILEADYVFLYFQKDTKSPISLLELGLCAGLGKSMVVCCPKGFWRKGNVDYICKKYDIEQIDSVDDLPKWLEDDFVE